MKHLSVIVVVMVLIAGTGWGAEERPLENQKDKLSYTIGVLTGSNLKQQSVDVNPDVMAKGIKDAFVGAKPLLSDQEMREVKAAFQKEMAGKQVEKRNALAEKNKKEGEAFLAENKTKEGVKTLPSGLQYKVIWEGTGKNPKATDAIVAHYRGTRIDGSEFDSSYQRDEPVTFKLDQVIKGWTEALVLMKEGAKWQIFIPSSLAYGENGSGPIEPNATLVFDIELLRVIQADGTAAQQTGKPAEKSSTAKSAEKTSKPAAKPSKPAAGK
jgi:FKBP-type peptidyl-prolyl cis-trans isomerase FklB